MPSPTREQAKAIVESFCNLVFVNEFDHVFNTAFDQLVSPTPNTANGLTSDQFRAMVLDFRNSITARRLIGSPERVLALQIDPNGTITAGQSAKISGMRVADGKSVVVSVVSVATVETTDGGVQIFMNSVVIGVEDV